MQYFVPISLFTSIIELYYSNLLELLFCEMRFVVISDEHLYQNMTKLSSDFVIFSYKCFHEHVLKDFVIVL